MTYLQILFVLTIAVADFILVLRWVRKKFPGDYTVIKVIGGMGLVTLAQVHAGRLSGLDWWTLWSVVLIPLAIGGALITLWQAGEALWRERERLHDRAHELFRSTARKARRP